MWSAWSRLRSSAVTEHDTELQLQSTAVANIIFVNIDWKRSRHDNPTCTNKNLKKLARTTASIVTNMQPAVICCCEVGTAMFPMTRDQMSEMAQTMTEAWRNTPIINIVFHEAELSKFFPFGIGKMRMF